MSSSIPGHDVPVPGSEPRSSPVARISRGALTANARAAWDRGIRSFDPSVLEADAWGHGSGLVREVLEAQGIVAAEAPVPRVEAGTAIARPSTGLSASTLFGLPGAEPPARTALRLSGTVLSVKDLRAGEGVSYGYAYRADADTRVALVTGGYAQGIVRGLGGAVDVAIAGERHPIVGRVAMDVCVVDIRDAAVRRGDEVLFLGDPAHGEPSLAEWVRATGLFAPELITAVGLRAIREEAP
ncbi:alanine racemase [Microbacterium sp. B35-04]|uniref:alanine racemase C-terminal domain-containing protein n=1 Tax=Microbacterium sp. B35-04 TaxID=1961716 RepID=UPI0013D7B993|nr:alanine racemase C-terminal domain-containing protein [Microbacterium sp. B35-04]KAF2411976.1 alanine racemase [Microbacterium sp. B35-04]